MQSFHDCSCEVESFANPTLKRCRVGISSRPFPHTAPWCRSDGGARGLVGRLKGGSSKPGDRVLASCLDRLFGRDGEERDFHV